MMIYGPVGIGKTTLAGSAADVDDMADVLLIDAEGGDMTLSDNPRIKHPERIMQVPVTTFMQLGQVHEYLKAHCVFRDSNNVDKLREKESWLMGIPPEQLENPHRFRTVIIDTITEAETYNMYSLLGVDQSKILTAGTGGADDVEVATWDEFRKNKMMVEILVRAFRDLPMHVILVAHQQYSEDEVKRKSYTPQLTGKLVNSVQGLVDIVGYLRDAPPPAPDPKNPTVAPKKIKRLFVQPAPQFAAKCRRPAFTGEYFDDPNMASIMKQVGLLQ